MKPEKKTRTDHKGLLFVLAMPDCCDGSAEPQEGGVTA